MSLTERFPQPASPKESSWNLGPVIDKPPFPNAKGIDENPDTTTTRIETPFYRTISEPFSPGTPEYYANFSPYSLFCLRTTIVSFVEHYPQFRSFCQDNKMRMYLVFDTKLPRDTEEFIAKIVRTTTDYGESPRCVLFDSTLPIVTSSGERIPNQWLERILPFVDFGQYSASLLLGIYEEPQDNKRRIYLDLSEVPNYVEEYTRLLLSAQQQLEDMWNRGTVRFARSIASAWSLEHLGDDLYQATWKDNRFAKSPTMFLLSRLRGERTLFVHVGSNLVRKHGVAKELSSAQFQFWFVNDFVEIVADNLYQARRAATIAFNEKRRATEKVIIKDLEYPTSFAELYKEAQGNVSHMGTVDYLQINHERLLTRVSTKIPLWIPQEEAQRRVEEDVSRAVAKAEDKEFAQERQ